MYWTTEQDSKQSLGHISFIDGRELESCIKLRLGLLVVYVTGLLNSLDPSWE